MNLNGGVAVVTGGASGIGLALSRRLHALGNRVALVDLHEAAAAEAAASLAAGPGGGTTGGAGPALGTGEMGGSGSGSGGTGAVGRSANGSGGMGAIGGSGSGSSGSAVGIGADVGDRVAVSAMIERVEAELGPITIYCSNAGVVSGPGLGSTDVWDKSWQVHVMAHVHAAEVVLPAMAGRGSGAFVITASAAGLLMMVQAAPYTVTKHAAVALAEWLAVDYGGRGVQLHCLCPQGVRTPMVMADARNVAEVAASGVILEPETVADAVVDAIADNRFLVLPHPEVRGYEQAKVADRDRWLAGMRRLKARVTGSAGDPPPVEGRPA